MVTPVPQLDLKRAWPWTAGFQRIIREVRPAPFSGSHLMFGSDYSGGHAGSRYSVYCFIVVDADASPDWPDSCRRVRKEFLRNGRTISFKGLNDGQKRRALVLFLEAAESLTGHVVAVITNKQFNRLSTGENSLELWRTLHGLSGIGKPRAFEELCRTSHFFSLLLGEWSRPGMNVTWITDEDEIVANDNRLDDALNLSARLSNLYVPHVLGEFAMNTVAWNKNEMSFEDFVGIPDLAAGMLAEVATKFWHQYDWSSGDALEFNPDQLTAKLKIIADWFWYPSEQLKKTSILIDRFDAERFIVQKVEISADRESLISTHVTRRLTL